MSEINWNNFRAKFNGKETISFESLSYQLFCSEHNLNIGIFRFKNQTGIETEPIQKNKEYIGFQAKYYETKISANKGDIIDSIKKAKSKNPQLNKILFYLNQEFSESTKEGKKVPKYKIDIETEAAAIKVIIDWRVPSHFERQLALPINKYLSDFFFSLDKNVIDFINGLKNHTENLLYSIQDDISFNTHKIKIDRSNILENLESDFDKSKTIIISGEGGCGKTAIIKELYQKTKNETPFYIFKAVEFNIQEIKSLFNNYGNYSLGEFIESHSQEKIKIVVIDSAEKISDLENQEPFKEFITELQKNKWSIIFTTRLSYLDDLRFQFIEVYRLPFDQIDIENLTEDELNKLSKDYSFKLPSNKKIRKLIENPFYLDEYLRNYKDCNKSANYSNFKDTLWSKKIKNSSFTKDNTHILRENCFLEIIKTRCDTGAFFIKPKNCLPQTLSLLQKDEIIGYDKNNGGYFITHDIYEEWGLNVTIDRTYKSAIDFDVFLQKLGTSLIIRRATRNWLSDKLSDNIEEIKPFIAYILTDKKIEFFWKDEILISILLSDYSIEFFNHFEKFIIKDNFLILKRIIFLLRISCKEVDNSFIKLLGKFTEDIDPNYIFTQPKGLGWNCTIDLIYKLKDSFTILDISFIIPLFQDWLSKNKKGETTKKASLFALKFYKELQLKNEFKYNTEFEKQLIKIIIQGASEISTELIEIFNKIVANNWSTHRDAYYELCSAMLKSNFDNISALIAIPQSTLKLADLFWSEPKGRKSVYDYGGIGVEKYYSINTSGHNDYYPASAFQTPIYSLLQFCFIDTINFILDFTNKSVESYVNSGFDKSVREIEIIIDEKQTQKQFISHCLWSMYRGTGSPITPYLLQSIHMALEKHLLEIAKKQDSIDVENWLIYLLKKSSSASITSVVTSVVLAFPDKFFNVAKILFSSIELFHFDNMRCAGEYHAKSLYSIGYGLNFRNKNFENERIKTCDEPHRRNSIENLALSYQFFRSENINEEESQKRLNSIWEILDRFYKNLPDKSNETDEVKITRLILARIDKRKMNPTVEQKGDQLLINFNPEIDADLEKHSQEAVKGSLDMMKYSGLKLWASYKFDESKKYGEYQQYDNDPKLVLKETKEIIKGLKTHRSDSYFHLFNNSIPAFTCSALIRDYSTKLSVKEKQFCKDIIIEYATTPFKENYQYQISDGVEVSINAIPFLFKLFPQSSEDLKTVLLLILFDTYPIGQYKRVCDYSIESILRNLWKISSDIANKILLGYLKFKPIINSIKKNFKKPANIQFNRYSITKHQVLEEFIKIQGNELKFFWNESVESIELDINKYSLNDLNIIFHLIPYDTINHNLLEYVSNLIPVFSEKLLKDDDRIDYSLRHSFFEKFSNFILFREKESINNYILPFVNNFTNSRETASFFQEIISTQDRVNQYEQFWLVWHCFYEKIIEMTGNSSGYHSREIIHNYLLAWPYWKDTAKEWHSFKEKDKQFFKNIVNDIGQNPSVLDSIAKLLNEIGSPFLNDGIFWISEMVEKSKWEKLETNTVYYIEILVRKYIYLNRSKVKQTIRIKNQIIIILNFLISHNSVNAYLLREDII